MIILEGTDNVGKTTMAEKLCAIMSRDLGGVPGQYYGHMSRPPEDFDHVAEYMKSVRVGVQDRYHLGSVVYGRILGGGTFPTARRMRIVQRYLRWQGCMVVIVTMNRDELRKRLSMTIEREEMYKTEQILDAGDAYAAMAVGHNMGEPWCDARVDVTTCWPSDKALQDLYDAWKRRFLL